MNFIESIEKERYEEMCRALEEEKQQLLKQKQHG